jgi:hypothetical protein
MFLSQAQACRLDVAHGQTQPLARYSQIQSSGKDKTLLRRPECARTSCIPLGCVADRQIAAPTISSSISCSTSILQDFAAEISPWRNHRWNPSRVKRTKPAILTNPEDLLNFLSQEYNSGNGTWLGKQVHRRTAIPIAGCTHRFPPETDTGAGNRKPPSCRTAVSPETHP